MARFKVTITKTITTEIYMDALNAADARKEIEDYGVDVAAVDMASDDVSVVSRIKSVAKAED